MLRGEIFCVKFTPKYHYSQQICDFYNESIAYIPLIWKNKISIFSL